MNRDTISNDPKDLLQLCRAGKLYEVERWIAAGRSLDISAVSKRRKPKSLLEVAVETGFYSLIELVAKHTTDQTPKDAGLRDAVGSRRLDQVELLLAHGASIKAVPLVDVLLTWEPQLIRFFLDHGADPLDGRPFGVAFGAKVRTALRPFIEYKRAHPEMAAQLQEQLDSALRHFCGEGDLKWVSLLIWAGGDPRSQGPCLEKDYTDDPECYTSGLEEACLSENVEVLKRLKPDRHRDDLSKLLHRAAGLARKETLAYLLQIGADSNDKANGGSSALDSVLGRLGWPNFGPYAANRLKSKYDVTRDLDCIRELLAHGAIWNPHEACELNWLRRALLNCEPAVTIEVLQMFRQHNACPAERVHKLLGTPRMKDHLKPETRALSRLGIDLDVSSNASRAGPRSRVHRSP